MKSLQICVKNIGIQKPLSTLQVNNSKHIYDMHMTKMGLHEHVVIKPALLT